MSQSRRPPEGSSPDSTPPLRPSLPAQSAGTSAAIASVIERRTGLPSFFPQHELDAESRALDALMPSIPPQAPAPEFPDPEMADPLTASMSLTPRATPETDPEGVAALRAAPRRLDPAAAVTLPRATLLTHLAEGCDGDAQARLLSSAAELHTHADDGARAQQLYEQAHAAAPRDVVALRELRKLAILSNDMTRAGGLLEQELECNLAPLEHALTSTALSELQRTGLSQLDNAEQQAHRAVDSHPRALAAGLALADLASIAGNGTAAAEALRRVAEMWDDERCRSALLLQAGRMLLVEGHENQALSLLERAGRGDSAPLSAHLETHRAAMAKGDLEVALNAIERAIAACPAGTIRDALLRTRARLLLDRRDAPAQALANLADCTGAAYYRLRARAAQAAGDRDQLRIALEHWAADAGGTERAIACTELAAFHLESGDAQAAEEHVQSALSAAPSLGLVQLMADWLARETGRRVSPAGTEAGDGASHLARAAKQCSSGTPDEEYAALAAALATTQEDATAQELAIDVAAQARPDAIATHLEARAARLATAQRLGPKLALLDLTRPQDLGASNTRMSDVMRIAPGHPAALCEQRCAAHSTAAKATAYRRIAEDAHGAHAAFAWTQSGRALELADQPPGDAYTRAQQDSPTHLPSAWALERTAGSDRKGRAARERSLAEIAAGPLERSARLVRAALLEDDEEATRAALKQATEATGNDVLLVELSLQHAGGDVPQTDSLLSLAEQAESALAGAMRLRAAAGMEQSQQWSNAAECYREVLKSDDDDDRGFARAGLLRCLQASGDDDGACEHLRGEVDAMGERDGHLARVAELAAALERAGHSDEALEARREIDRGAPGHLPTLRAMARLAARKDDDALALHASRGLARHLNNPLDRTPQLRVAAALLMRQGDQPELDAMITQANDRADRDDGWFAGMLEDAARRAGDAELVMQAVMRSAELLEHPLERASLAMRAAEAIEPISIAQASVALMGSARGAPEHPVASEELGRLCRGAGEFESAAVAYEAAAASAPTRERAVRLWYAAGCIRQDQLGEREAARDTLHHVAELDLLHQNVLERLVHLHESLDDRAGLADLLERRIGLEIPTPASTYLKLVELREELGQPERARETLSRCVDAYPTHLDTLEKLADTYQQDEQWTQAAERLVQLARMTNDSEQTRRTFFRLGDIYTRNLPDLRRAEIAFKRCLNVNPGDRAALERLLEVFVRSDQKERATRTIDHLLDLAKEPAEIERYTLRKAEVLQEIGKPKHAERLLTEYNEQHPTSVAAVDALARLYANENDTRALSVLMHRSFHTFRTQLTNDPTLLPTWAAFHRFAQHQSSPEIATAVERAAAAVGFTRDELRGEDDGAPAPEIAPQAERMEMLSRMRADNLAPAVLRFFQAAAPTFEQVLPLEPSFADHHPLPAPPERLGTACAAAQQAFDLEGVRIEQKEGRGCHPIAGAPLTIVLGVDTLAEASEAELTAMLLGHAALAHNGLYAAIRCPEGEFIQCFHALVKHLDPNYVVPEELEEGVTHFQPLISRALTSNARTRIDAALQEMAYEYSSFDPAALRRAACDYWPRAALVLTGDCTNTLGALLRSLGEGSLAGGSALRAVTIRRQPEALDLLAFALSQTHFDAISPPAARPEPIANDGDDDGDDGTTTDAEDPEGTS